MKWNWDWFRVDLEYCELFPILRFHLHPSRLLTVLLWTLWRSIKPIKAPHIFDWEQEGGLQAMQRNWGSSHGNGDVIWSFSSCTVNVGCTLELWRGWSLRALAYSVISWPMSSYEENLSNLLEVWQGNTDAARGEELDAGSILVASVILGILPIFNQSQALSPFEALDSACLSRYQRDVRSHVQTRRRLKHSLGSAQGIQTSLHLVTWKMTLHSSHDRIIRTSFESGHLGVHSTRSSKLRFPLT